MGNGRDREPKSTDELVAEIREKQAEQGIEVKWTKWMAAAAFASSTLGQLANLRPPESVIDLFGRLFWGG